MKRVIPVAILALLVPMGLSAPPVSAAPEPASEHIQPIQRNGSPPPKTLYVDDTGTNSTPCGASAAEACQTINLALEQAQTDDTVIVAAGTYNEAILIRTANVKILGSGSGTEVQQTITIAADGVTLDSLNVKKGTGDRGIMIGTTSIAPTNVSILNSHVEGWTTGISFNGSRNPSAASPTIKSNTFKANSSSIASSGYVTDLLLQDNTFIASGSASLGDEGPQPITLRAPISGNTFTGGTNRRYLSLSATATLSGQTFEQLLTQNTFDKGVAVSSATGSWYAQAIFPTIGGAIGAASHGATINVAAGTYEERIFIDKPLTLLGPNATKAGNASGRATEATIKMPLGSKIEENLINVGRNYPTDRTTNVPGFGNVTIAGLNLTCPDDRCTGPSNSVYHNLISTFRIGDLTVRNNRMYGGGVALNVNTGGIGDYRQGLVVEGNYIDGGPWVNSSFNRGMYIQATAGTIQDNVVVNTNIGIQYMPYSHTAPGTIQRNTIQAGLVGLYHNYQNTGAALVTWTHNTVTVAPNDRLGTKASVYGPWTTPVGFRGAQVLTFGSQGTGEAPKVVFENNLIDATLNPDDTYNSTVLRAVVFGNFEGGETPPKTASGGGTASFSDNSFTGWTQAVLNDFALPNSFKMERNWWGTSDDTAIAAGINNRGGGVIDYDPWIVGYASNAVQSGFVPTQVVLSSNQLSDLSLKPEATLLPKFSPGITDYATSVDNATTSVTVTPTTPVGSVAVIEVDDSVVASGVSSDAIPLAVGENTIKVVSTSGDDSATYTIRVTRAASSVSTLSGLALSDGTLSPGFSAGTTAYSASVGNAVTSMTVTPTATDRTSTITVNGSPVSSGTASGPINLSEGSNTVLVVVTAENGVAQTTYTITVTRAAAPPDPGPIPIPTPTPTPTPSPSPSPTPVPVPTPLPPGEAEVIVDGQPQTVVVEPQPDDAGLKVIGDGFELELDAAAPNGTEVPVRTEDGRSVLVLETEGFTRTAGTGFQPGSETYVWLFSEPTLLGAIPVDAQGRFVGEVSLPVDIGPGEHMLQVTGTTPTGATRALVLGVVVEPAAVPGAPTNVTPVPGNRQVAVAWTPPSRPGATRITGYRIEQSRNGGPWTVAIGNTGSASPASRASATVRNLINGDDYRFRITAINAAGLGRVSEPSASTSPEAPEGRSIAIVGQRTTIDGKSGVRVRGETTGFTRKASLRSWIRLPGQTAFIQGQGRIRLKADGTFTWKRKTGKRITVYIQAGDGTRSNRVTIPAR